LNKEQEKMNPKSFYAPFFFCIILLQVGSVPRRFLGRIQLCLNEEEAGGRNPFCFREMKKMNKR